MMFKSTSTKLFIGAIIFVVVASIIPATVSIPSSFAQEPPETGPILVCSNRDNGFSADMDIRRQGMETAIAYIDNDGQGVFLCKLDGDAETIESNDEINPASVQSVDTVLTESGDAFVAADTGGDIETQECINSDAESCFEPDSANDPCDPETEDCPSTCPPICGDSFTSDSDAQIIFVQSSSPNPNNPQVEAEGNNRYVVWEENRAIKFNVNHENGVPGSWEDPIQISAEGRNAAQPLIYAAGSFVHIAWIQGNDIWYSRSINSGETFDDPINLSRTSGPSRQHDLTGDPRTSNVYVTWQEQNKQIWFRNSNNDGGTFDATKVINRSNAQSEDPDLGAFNDRVVDCWTEREGNRAEIFCRHSSDGGDTFGRRVNVSDTPNAESKSPSVDFYEDPDAPNGEVYVGWLEKGLARDFIRNNVFAVAVADSDDGQSYSDPVLLFDDADNPIPNRNARDVQINQNVAVMDPIARRG